MLESPTSRRRLLPGVILLILIAGTAYLVRSSLLHPAATADKQDTAIDEASQSARFSPPRSLDAGPSTAASRVDPSSRPESDIAARLAHGRQAFALWTSAGSTMYSHPGYRREKRTVDQATKQVIIRTEYHLSRPGTFPLNRRDIRVDSLPDVITNKKASLESLISNESGYYHVEGGVAYLMTEESNSLLEYVETGALEASHQPDDRKLLHMTFDTDHFNGRPTTRIRIDAAGGMLGRYPERPGELAVLEFLIDPTTNLFYGLRQLDRSGTLLRESIFGIVEAMPGLDEAFFAIPAQTPIHVVKTRREVTTVERLVRQKKQK